MENKDLQFYPNLTIDEFRSSEENIKGLRDYLQTPSGQNLIRVMRNVNPLFQDANPANLSKGKIDYNAIVDSKEKVSIAKLNFSKGFEMAFRLVTETLTSRISVKRTRKSSSKQESHKHKI